MIQRQASKAPLELLRADINAHQVLVAIFSFKHFYDNDGTSSSKLNRLRTPSCMVYKKETKKIAVMSNAQITHHMHHAWISAASM